MARPVGDITELTEAMRTIPQQLIIQLFGWKQGVQVRGWAEKWNCPVGGATVDMFEVFAWLKNFFHAHGTTLRLLLEDADEGEEVGLGAQFLRAKIDKTTEDAKMARIRRELKEGTILDQATISMGLELMADKIRQAGEQAQRQWGSDGFDLYDTMLKGFVADIERLFEKTQDGDTQAAVDPADEAVRPVGDDPPAESDGSIR